MEDLDELFRQADDAGVRLAVSESALESVRGEAVLFDAVQVPIVALAVVAALSGRRKGEAVDALGARVGHALTSAFPAFGRVGRYLQWSIRVRTVTVEAMGLLEESNMIVVIGEERRRATLTVQGRSFIAGLRSNEEALALYKTLSAAFVRTRNEELRLL